MKLHLNSNSQDFQIRSCTLGETGFRVSIGDKTLSNSLVVSPSFLEEWDIGDFDQLSESHFDRLAGFPCEVMILGTGKQTRFPKPSDYRPLVEAGIGLEVMDTAAACRTYNILLGDGRQVVAALIL